MRTRWIAALGGLLAAGAMAACSSQPETTPEAAPTAPTPIVAETSPDVPVASWGEEQRVDAVALIIHEPRPTSDGGAEVDVSVVNGSNLMLRSVEVSPVINGAVSDDHIYMGDDPGDEIAVPPRGMMEYTVLWHDIDPAAELGAQARVFYDADMPGFGPAHWFGR